MELKLINILANWLFILVCIGYCIYSYKKYKRITSEVEDLKFELSKLSFMLFVAEKKKEIGNQ